MKVLAIDPGYGRCGMAIVEKNPSTPFDPSTELRVAPRNSRGDKAQGKPLGTSGRETLIHSVCVETSPKADFAMRLAMIVAECSSLLHKHKPDCVAIEKLFVTKNQKTAMRVAEVRGALISCATSYGVPVFEYTPGEVKSATAGWGGADKQQVATMLHALMTIEKEIEHDDEYDAIAIGVTHLARVRH